METCLSGKVASSSFLELLVRVRRGTIGLVRAGSSAKCFESWALGTALADLWVATTWLACEGNGFFTAAAFLLGITTNSLYHNATTIMMLRGNMNTRSTRMQNKASKDITASRRISGGLSTATLSFVGALFVGDFLRGDLKAGLVSAGNMLDDALVEARNAAQEASTEAVGGGMGTPSFGPSEVFRRRGGRIRC